MACFKPLLTQIAIDLLYGLQVRDPTPEQMIAAESLIVTIFGEKKSACHIQLQPNEWRCLYWAAQGKSIKETAHILHLSFGTVSHYHRQIKVKLGCKKLIQVAYLLASQLDCHVWAKN